MKVPFIMERADIVGVIWDEELGELPILVATDDFFEYLEEQGYEDTMTADELVFELQDYIRTECKKIQTQFGPLLTYPVCHVHGMAYGARRQG